MSEMEHKRGLLIPVMRYGEHVNIQDWMESEWSVYIDEALNQETAYEVLQEFMSSEDIPCNYYLFNDNLYEMTEERELDPFGYVEARSTTDGIEVAAHWYNGGGSWEECISSGLKKLEEEQK